VAESFFEVVLEEELRVVVYKEVEVAVEVWRGRKKETLFFFALLLFLKLKACRFLLSSGDGCGCYFFTKVGGVRLKHAADEDWNEGVEDAGSFYDDEFFCIEVVDLFFWWR